ncbi:MAG: Rne/Rng family ribonuclease [Cyanobacteria bacterium J06639_1]
MSKQIIIAEQHRIAAVFAEDQIQELVVASGTHQVGDVHLGIIENVLPSIDAAFVNIGNPERNGFIHVSDLGQARLKRNSASITELVAPQQKVLVQVMKEPTGNKGPRLTGKLSFPGRHLVLVPHGRGVHLSSRIREEEERNRLKALAILIKPAQTGIVVRTEADGASEDSIIEDLDRLNAKWERIRDKQESSRAPALLQRDEDFIQRVLRDAFSSSDVNRIVADTDSGAQRVRQFLQHWNEGQIPQGVAIGVHREAKSILEYFRVNAAIKQALRPRVDLPSGGYIIIEPTEALTVVDVNSGSFTRSATSRETVLWTNCEAATEIARQLRLRNIAGVIVVDFIDMDSRRDQLQVLEHFQKALRSDKARPQIAQLSELGLVELTRKRQGQSIYEVFGRPCPTCEGLGVLAHLPGASPEEGESVAATVVSRNGGSSSSSSATETPSSRSSDRDRPSSRRKRNYSGSRRFNGASDSRSTSAPPPPVQKDTERPKPAPAPVEKPAAIALDTEIPDQPPPADAPASSVAVEMTPLQQQVYSEMGLSPQLLVDKSVKVGRNTTINVVLPGEQPPQVEPSRPAGKISAADRRAMRRANSPARRRTQPGVIDLSQTDVKSADEEEQPDETANVSQPPPATEAKPVKKAEVETDAPAEADAPAIAAESDAPSAESITKTQKSPAASRRRRSRSS